jgi:hypothetical protein
MDILVCNSNFSYAMLAEDRHAVIDVITTIFNNRKRWSGHCVEKVGQISAQQTSVAFHLSEICQENSVHLPKFALPSDLLLQTDRCLAVCFFAHFVEDRSVMIVLPNPESTSSPFVVICR